MPTRTNTSRIVVSLDDLSIHMAREMIEALREEAWGFKGNVLLDQALIGEVPLHYFMRGAHFWADQKLHDIANTVGNRAAEYATAGVDLLSTHASGGRRMLTVGRVAFDQHKKPSALGMLAVTLLTDLSEQECKEIYTTGIADTINRFLRFGIDAGVAGFVCSPTDLVRAREHARWYCKEVRVDFNQLKWVTPGVRLAGVNAADQIRAATPAVAIRNGADLLVVGRPIVEDKTPQQALEALRIFNREVEQALVT